MSWERKKLNEIIDIKKGKYITKKDSVVGPYPVILGGREPAYYINQFNHIGKAIVVSRSGASAGYVSFWDEPIFVTDGFLIEPKSSVDIEFLYYLMKVHEGEFLGLQGGSAIPHVTPRTIGSVSVLLPPMEIQLQIVDILKGYDDLIENNNKQIKLLEEAAQRLYKEWFVDLRFPGYEDVEIVDGVPEGWKKTIIGEIVKTTSGATPSRTHTEYYNNGTNLWVKTKELEDGFIFNTEEKITDDAIKKSSAKIVPKGSILLAMYGATIGKLGIAAKELACNQACCVFMFDEQEWKREYLYCWLITNREYLISQGKGAAQPNLSQASIQQFKIVLPDEKLLKKFSNIVSDMFKQKCNLELQIIKLKEVRDRLLPKLMNEEIEV